MPDDDLSENVAPAVFVTGANARVNINSQDHSTNTTSQAMCGQHLSASPEWFDRRYKVFADVEAFMSAVLRQDGDITLVGPGEYRDFCEARKMGYMLFGPAIRNYLDEVDATARGYWAAKRTISKAIQTGNQKDIDTFGRVSLEMVRLFECRMEIFRPEIGIVP
jgi:hypothetical protein